MTFMVLEREAEHYQPQAALCEGGSDSVQTVKLGPLGRCPDDAHDWALSDAYEHLPEDHGVAFGRDGVDYHRVVKVTGRVHVCRRCKATREYHRVEESGEEHPSPSPWASWRRHS